jgi:hypothetical protein
MVLSYLELRCINTLQHVREKYFLEDFFQAWSPLIKWRMGSTVEEYVTELNENDVLFGRGSGPNDHEGNVRFRKLVNSRKGEYMATSHRQTKARIAREIVDSVLAKNGRFLKKAEPEESKVLGIPPGVDAWLLVDDETIMEKAKQALRQNREKEKVAGKSETKVIKAELPTSSTVKKAAPQPPPVAPIREPPYVTTASAQDDLFAAYGVASMPVAAIPNRRHLEVPNVAGTFAPQVQSEIPMQPPAIIIPDRAYQWGGYETNYGISQQALQQPPQHTIMYSSLQQAMQPMQQAMLQPSQQTMMPSSHHGMTPLQQNMPPPLPVQNDRNRSYDDERRNRYPDDSRRESIQVQDLTTSFNHMKTAERGTSGEHLKNYDSSDTMGTIEPIAMGSSSVGMSVASMSSSTLSVLKGAFGESMASTSFGDDDGGAVNRRGSYSRPTYSSPQDVTSLPRPTHDVSLRFSQVWQDKNKAGILAITEESDEQDGSSGRISDPRPLSIMQDAPDNLSSLGQSSLSIMKAAFEGGMGSSNETYGSPMQEGNNSSDVSSQMISSNEGTSSGLSSMGASTSN